MSLGCVSSDAGWCSLLPVLHAPEGVLGAERRALLERHVVRAGAV